MFSAPFSFKGRIRRLEYGLSILIYYGLIFVVGFILGLIGVTDGEIGDNEYGSNPKDYNK